MGPIRMPGRGLTPILVLVIAVPPRVCTCDHFHEPAPVTCLAEPVGEHHDHDDHDCPCLKPAQIEPTILAAAVAASPPDQSDVLAICSDADVAVDTPAPTARRTGDPPLYLSGCALRC